MIIILYQKSLTLTTFLIKYVLRIVSLNDPILVYIRGAKQGGLGGGVSTPPEFWMGGGGGLNTCQPPLILRKKFLEGVGAS